MDDRRPLTEVFRGVRATTESLCAPLEADDFSLQANADTSPPKWHLAHTSWFFETFVLRRFCRSWEPVDERYAVLFNSYYDSVGPQHPRPQRALLSRPTVAEVLDYRRRVDDAVVATLADAGDPEAERLVAIGLEHEQQHQELLLMDLRCSLHENPVRPAYRADLAQERAETPRLEWIAIDGGICEIGAAPDADFAYDNERPRHRVLLDDFEIASRCVTCGEWIEFLAAGGYERAELWLSDGWAWRQREGISAPLYWEPGDGSWQRFSLAGMRPVDPHAPVSHVSYYEADAFARWAGCRLPTEAEWEVAATSAAAASAPAGALLEDDLLEPAPARGDGLAQLIGDVWELTASPYAPYPGYTPPAGALGEYNGKFMCNQIVLRGGSCLTPRAHIRPSYRNFFYPHQRWNTQGLRLAR